MISSIQKPLNCFGDLLTKPIKPKSRVLYACKSKRFVIDDADQVKGMVSSLPRIVKLINQLIQNYEHLVLSSKQQFALFTNLLRIKPLIAEYNQGVGQNCCLPCCCYCQVIKLDLNEALQSVFEKRKWSLEELESFTELNQQGFSFDAYVHPMSMLVDTTLRTHKVFNDQSLRSCFRILARLTSDKIYEEGYLRPLSVQMCAQLVTHVAKFPDSMDTAGNYCLFPRLPSLAAECPYAVIYAYISNVAEKEADLKQEVYEDALSRIMCKHLSIQTACDLLSLAQKNKLQILHVDTNVLNLLLEQFDEKIAGIISDFDSFIDPFIENLFWIIAHKTLDLQLLRDFIAASEPQAQRAFSNFLTEELSQNLSPQVRNCYESLLSQLARSS